MKQLNRSFAQAIALESPREIIECDKCGSIRSVLLDKLRVYMKGKKIADYYTVSNHNIISGKFQDVLKNESIKGYKLKEIKVDAWVDGSYKKIDNDYTDLMEIDIIGRCGYLRNLNGVIIEKCEKCHTEHQDEIIGLSVDINSWDKSDIFYFDNWIGNIIVTERVKKLVEKENLKNITFINVKDFKYPSY